MDKRKIVPIILLLIILGVGFVAYTFYSENKNLKKENEMVKEERGRLIEDKNRLTDKYNKLEATKNDVEDRLSRIKDKLTSLEGEAASWKRKYNKVSEERGKLIEKLKKKPRIEIAERREKEKEEAQVPSEDYWADFIKAKAELEAQLDDLYKEISDARSKIAELDKNNKELSIKIDELTKQRERLGRDIRFKERTMNIMSRDLVNEREERRAAVEELNKLRSENVSLKRELILTNKDKVDLQEDLKKTKEKKDNLAQRIGDAEKILKEKSIALEELQEQLTRTIKGEIPPLGERQAAAKTHPVELPPIVVKPERVSKKGLRGEVIAVNEEEGFVVIDKGELSGVTTGLQLKVMRGDKEVGTVEVIETRKEIAAADIKEVLSGFTIKEGDAVISK